MIKLAPEQFDALDAEAAELLTKRGFAVVNRQRNGPYGSHSSEYERGKERISLSYDEKTIALFSCASGIRTRP
jgi:hypothetical protein